MSGGPSESGERGGSERGPKAEARPVDLRSDTVTQPTPAMRRAMAEAEVGDDVYGEDPTVRRLEARCAVLFGKEAGLFVPSGSAANQLALCAHVRPGEEVLLAPGSHVYQYESGGMTALAGAQPYFIGERGVFSAAEVRAAVRPRTDYYPRTRLCWFENTHNIAGGRVFPLETMREASVAAAELGLARHLDGARILNACARSGVEPADYGMLVDSLSLCFSKGLGAPVGSMLLGTAAFIGETRFLRRRFGGAMRQVGILAAAADHGLTHHRAQLTVDHENARWLGEALATVPGVRVDLASVETNMVLFDVEPPLPDAPAVAARLAAAGVLVNAPAARRLRAVTHLDVSRADLEVAMHRLGEALRS